MNADVVNERTGAIDSALAESKRRDTQSVASADLKNQRDLISAQSELNTTTAQRRDSAMRLLDLQYQQERIELEGIQASKTATSAQKQIAKMRLDALPALQKADEASVGRSNETAGQKYVRSLTMTAGERAEYIDEKAIGYLEKFNSQLNDSVKSALHLHGIFGDIIGDLIDMAIKQAIIKPLANSLFGGGGSGGGGGLFGSLLKVGSSALGSAFGGGGASSADSFLSSALGGRASGGRVGAGELVRINEGSSPGNVEGWRPQGSGDVIPLGRMNAIQGGGGVTVMQTVSVDARGAVMNDQFAEMILSRAGQQAIVSGRAAYAASQSELQRMARPNLPGSLG